MKGEIDMPQINHKPTLKTGGGIKEALLIQTKDFVERAGVYIFFISLISFTQIDWVKQHNKYNQIEARLLLSVFIGMLLSFGIINLIKKTTKKSDAKFEGFLSKLSITLTPGVLFVFASRNKIFLIAGAILCVLTALYLWVKPFRNFIKSVVHVDKFRNTLIIKNGEAVIEVAGTYEKADLQTIQSFLIDLSINFNECAVMKIEAIKVDFSNLKEGIGNELKALLETVARYFNLKITY